MGLRWEKLSPEEFQQLQDLASYSNKKLKDVMEEFNVNGIMSRYQADGDVDYNGFKLFMDTYLEVDTPDELCRHLFLSFIKRTAPRQSSSPLSSCGTFPDGKVIKEMAVSSSTAAVAAITPHNASLSSLVTNSVQVADPPVERHHGGGLVDKLHEFTERLQSLSHRRSQESSSESSSSSKSRSGISGMGVRLSVGEDDEQLTSFQNNEDSSGNVDELLSISTGENYRGGPSGSRAFPHIDINSVSVPLKDVVCYLSLLEGGRPEDKLEFMFRLYDTDGNGVLDTYEMDCIVNQMMNVAEYLGWDVSELKPILEDMMQEIDYNCDGLVSLQEWKQGGLTTVPLLVLLGLDQNVKEDGNHLWKLKHFNRPAYCNLCLTMLVGVGKKGLCCVLYYKHITCRCVQRCPNSCITTYVKSKKTSQVFYHHYVEGNCHGKCSKCKKTIKSYNGITGLHCRWCQVTLHNHCAAQMKPECTLGELRPFILPPSSICPVVLDRQRSFTREGRPASSGLPRPSITEISEHPGECSSSCIQELPDTPIGSGPMSFQITPLDNTTPLLVFINPKSGGQQGPRLFRKFQYLLNPRQVYDITCGGPSQALQMFRECPNLRILLCGGDGSVGWLLDAMDKVKYLVQPPVAILPLGTGNDLARCLMWGGGYDGESVKKIFKKIERASPVMMDRWEVTLTDVDQSELQGDPMPYNIINNYFSVGVDAAICVKFHLEREKNPHKFNSRMRNKMWYFEFSMSEQFTSSCKNLHQELEIECDGVSLELDQGPALQGLALLNIPYTHGGTNMWGDHLSKRRAKQVKQRHRTSSKPENQDSKKPGSTTNNLSTAFQDIGDKLIEVIGLEDCLHMGQVRTGLRASGRRLAQCSSVVIRTKKRLPMQIDGEPWLQNKSTISISHKNQVPMLMGPAPRTIFSFLRLS